MNLAPKAAKGHAKGGKRPKRASLRPSVTVLPACLSLSNMADIYKLGDLVWWVFSPLFAALLALARAGMPPGATGREWWVFSICFRRAKMKGFSPWPGKVSAGRTPRNPRPASRLFTRLSSLSLDSLGSPPLSPSSLPSPLVAPSPPCLVRLVFSLSLSSGLFPLPLPYLLAVNASPPLPFALSPLVPNSSPFSLKNFLNFSSFSRNSWIVYIFFSSSNSLFLPHSASFICLPRLLLSPPLLFPLSYEEEEEVWY